MSSSYAPPNSEKLKTIVRVVIRKRSNRIFTTFKRQRFSTSFPRNLREEESWRKRHGTPNRESLITPLLIAGAHRVPLAGAWSQRNRSQFI